MRNGNACDGFSAGSVTARTLWALVVLTIPFLAFGQDAGPVPLLPGDPRASGAALEAHSARYRLVTMSGGSVKVVGTMDAQLSRILEDGEELLRLRTDLVMGGTSMSYEFDFDARTLSAIVTRQDDPSGKLIVRFGNDGVEGTIVPRGATAPEPVSAPLEGRIFEAGTVNYLLAALAVAEGYEAKLPSFDLHELASGWITVRVTGREEKKRAEGRVVDAWVIEIDQLGDTRSKVWLIDEPPYWIRQELGDGSYWWELVG